jgi:hypothetical protein
MAQATTMTNNVMTSEEVLVQALFGSFNPINLCQWMNSSSVPPKEVAISTMYSQVTPSSGFNHIAERVVADQDVLMALQRHWYTMHVSDKNRLGFRPLGLGPVSDDVRVFSGDNCDVVLMNLAEDPLYKTCGNKFPMPMRVSKAVKKITRLGLDFDALYIAHEIPPGIIKTGETIPSELLMPPVPQKASARVDKLNSVTARWWTAVGMTMAMIARITSDLAIAAVMAPLAVGAMALAPTGRDPWLLGVNFAQSRSHQNNLGFWYSIAQWTWD